MSALAHGVECLYDTITEDNMLTRFTIIAACALIGQADAFDFNPNQATRLFAMAEMADQNCPGMKLNFAKVGKILSRAGVKADALDDQVRAV